MRNLFTCSMLLFALLGAACSQQEAPLSGSTHTVARSWGPEQALLSSNDLQEMVALAGNPPGCTGLVLDYIRPSDGKARKLNICQDGVMISFNPETQQIMRGRYFILPEGVLAMRFTDLMETKVGYAANRYTLYFSTGTQAPLKVTAPAAWVQRMSTRA